jgi:hypothetical protein
MPAITPAFLYDLETDMRLVTSQEYQRLTQNLWWTKVAKQGTSQSKKERTYWLLDTARIQRTGKGGGNVEFEDIVSNTQEFEHENAAAGLKIKKEQLEDNDGRGIDEANHWSRQMGALAAYWPQHEVAKAILANPTTYDGLPFFHASHPYNPYNSAVGTFANIFTGSEDGIYPGACPIDDSVTLETAYTNLAKLIAYIASLKMPNGDAPRGLRVASIVHPPRMTARVQQLTQAKFIAQAANSAAGSSDVSMLIKAFGLGEPVEAPELQAGFGGSDTTFYLTMEPITSDEKGAWLYSQREAFGVNYYGPQNDAQLARIREYQWTTEGRNIVAPGHPYLMFKCQKT